MNQSAFDILDSKYGAVPAAEPAGQDQQDIIYLVTDAEPQSIQPDPVDPRPTLTDWKQSQAVCLLSVFLKEFKDQGIYLKQTKAGTPVLSFNPGLKSKDKDPDRWAMGTHAADLFDNARQDLQELIINDALNLQIDTGIWL